MGQLVIAFRAKRLGSLDIDTKRSSPGGGQSKRARQGVTDAGVFAPIKVSHKKVAPSAQKKK